MSENENKRKFDEADNLLKKANRYFFKKNYSKARETAVEAQKIFSQTKSSLREADCIIIQAEIDMNQKNWQKATELFKSALSLQQVVSPLNLLIRSFYNLTLTTFLSHDFENSHIYAQKSIDLADQIKDPQTKLNSCIIQGKMYIEEQEYKSAFFYLNLAVEEIKLKKNEDFYQSGKIFSLLGLTLNIQYEYATSIEMYDKAIEFYEKKKKYSILSGIYYQNYLNHYFLGNTEKAIKSITKAISIRESLKIMNNNVILAKFYLKRAELYFNQSIENLTILDCEKSIEISEENGLNKTLVQGLMQMVKIHLNFEMQKEKKIDLINNYLREIDTIVEKEKLEELSLHNSFLQLIFIEKLNLEDSIVPSLQKLCNNVRIQQYPVLYCEIFEKIALIHHNKKEYSIAEPLFKKTLKYLPKLNNDIIKSSVYYNISCNMNKLHKPEETILYLSKAFKISPFYREIARNDPDLSELINNDRFLNLL